MDADWYLMCPHEILMVKGYALEDFWGEEWERRYWDCVNDARIEKRVISVKEIVRLVLRSAVETGTPFAFNRDTVNRMNPNGHCGVIYSSNLCTEIAQNMAPVQSMETDVRTVDGETVVITTTKPGDFVVCNLASLSLGNLPVEDDACLKRTVETAVRALDNVIDLNFYPVAYAGLTNRSYRGVGLGVSGYHHTAICWTASARRSSGTRFSIIGKMMRICSEETHSSGNAIMPSRPISRRWHCSV